MVTTNAMVQNAQRGLQEVKDRVEQPMHRVWPFRRAEQGNEGEREFISFPVDIYETDDAFILTAEMPGVSRDGVDVRLSENELIITGQFEVALDKDESLVYREIPGADYRRSFTLSDAVDRDQVKADLKDGILTVTLAKQERVKPRMIEIAS